MTDAVVNFLLVHFSKCVSDNSVLVNLGEIIPLLSLTQTLFVFCLELFGLEVQTLTSNMSLSSTKDVKKR